MNANIEIKELPELNVAYVSQIGEEGLDAAFKKIIDWAKPRGLLEAEALNLVRIYHDSFTVTSADKVRMSIGIVLALPVEVEGDIKLSAIEKGKYIVGHFEIEPRDFKQSWTALFVFMNENGFKKKDVNPFEIIHNDFNNHPEGKCIVDLYIGVL